MTKIVNLGSVPSEVDQPAVLKIDSRKYEIKRLFFISNPIVSYANVETNPNLNLILIDVVPAFCIFVPERIFGVETK